METLASFSASLWVSLLGLVFGTFQIMIPRSQNVGAVGLEEENSWGFGQLMPLILLVQPIGAVLEQLAVHPKVVNEKRDGCLPSIHSHPLAAHEDLGVVESQRHQQVRPTRHFLTFCGSHTPSPIRSRIPHQHSEPEEILLASWLFHCSVLLIQPALIAGSIITFYNDSRTIGIWATENWFVVLFVFVTYLGCSWLLVLVMAPFSHIGRTLAASMEQREDVVLAEMQYKTESEAECVTSSVQSIRSADNAVQ